MITTTLHFPDLWPNDPQFQIQTAPLDNLDDLWSTASREDEQYIEIVNSLKRKDPKFPAHLGVKISMSHCELHENKVFYKNRGWVPSSEPLRTALIQRCHDSPISGHPGKEGTYALLARDFFLAQHVFGRTPICPELLDLPFLNCLARSAPGLAYSAACSITRMA